MRKSKPKKRVVLPDPVFNESMVTKFVNHLMYDGKKSTAFDIFYGDPHQYAILALLPSYTERKSSSLVYMADKLISVSGNAASGFYQRNTG